MIKSVLNWTFGSFFRTLGRLLCFLLVGGLIAFLISKLDINMPKFEIFMDVYADVQPYGDTYLTSQFWGDTGLNHVINFSGSPSASHSTIILYNDAGLTYRDYVYFIVVGCRHGNDITGAVSTRSSGAKIGQMSIYNSQEACNDGYQGKITYMQYQVTLWGNVDDTGEELIADANASLYGSNYLYIMNKYFSNEDTLLALIQGQTTYDLIEQQLQQSINNTTNIINNQNSNTEAINGKLDDMNTSINSSDIDSSSGVNFFNNFNTEDNGGISSVITAPLRFVRKMTDSCEPISFDLMEQDINLPCGDTLFWNKEGVAPLRTIWNILVGGAFIYALLRKIFKIIEDIKDPQSDKIEVLNL